MCCRALRVRGCSASRAGDFGVLVMIPKCGGRGFPAPGLKFIGRSRDRQPGRQRSALDRLFSEGAA
jgi:hypothetical protein